MREIKFRAWDEEDKLMLQPDDICNLDGETSKELALSSPFWVLEQFTGLCDKNGKEIYEGDILKTDNEPPMEVVFSFAQFKISDSFTTTPICDAICPSGFDCEVIGNIHESEDTP